MAQAWMKTGSSGPCAIICCLHNAWLFTFILILQFGSAVFKLLLVHFNYKSQTLLFAMYGKNKLRLVYRVSLSLAFCLLCHQHDIFIQTSILFSAYILSMLLCAEDMELSTVEVVPVTWSWGSVQFGGGKEERDINGSVDILSIGPDSKYPGFYGPRYCIFFFIC